MRRVFRGKTQRIKEMIEKINQPPSSAILTKEGPFPLPGFSKPHAEHLLVLLLFFRKSLFTLKAKSNTCIWGKTNIFNRKFSER